MKQQTIIILMVMQLVALAMIAGSLEGLRKDIMHYVEYYLKLKLK